jgi:hypothetical protein
MIYDPIGQGDAPSEAKTDYLSWATSYEARGLTFETKDDAINFARNSAKSGDDRHLGQLRGFAKRYVDGEIVFNIGKHLSGSVMSQFTLSGVPFGNRAGGPDNPVSEKDGVIDHSMGSDDDHPMYISIPDLVKTPQGFVPAFVRLEREYKIPQTGGDTLSPSFKDPLSGGMILAKGELSKSGVGILGENRNRRKYSVIKSGSQAVDCIEGDADGISGGEVSIYSNFVASFAGRRIEIGELFIRLGLSELL